MLEITSAQARAYLAHLHFSDARNQRDDPVDALIAHVKRLGCVQYDPLDVVGRNPDLVMQSRIPGYKPAMLYDALYQRRALFEGFDKNLAIYRAEDFPHFARGRAHNARIYAENPTVAQALPGVLAEVRARGALCSDDLPLTEKVRWPWGTARLSRAALETLWMAGHLALHRREGARRYYDLIERCLPADIRGAAYPHVGDAAYDKWQLARRVRSVGMLTGGASDALLGTGMKAAARNAALDALVAEGALYPVFIGDLKYKVYLSALDRETLERAAREEPAPVARVIAPLDNLMWDRKLIETLFGFTYRWEVYVPKEKRKYGYYVLPILCGDRFIARIEPAPFRGGRLDIQNIWWEDEVEPSAYADALANCLDDFSAYLGADGWRIAR
ncbi:MAG: winged helix-turn-helix domain-containing protein [Christensenellales bacterium]|jgi:uncharacterized protein YcaQ